jgi:hypothetical protein
MGGSQDALAVTLARASVATKGPLSRRPAREFEARRLSAAGVRSLLILRPRNTHATC